MSFRVLFVCTGNVCRSPLGERLLRSRLPDAADIAVASAGVYALEGRAMDDNSALALRELGGDPDGHRAQWLTDPMVRAADLILAAETAHRDVVLRVAPGKMRRAFTMREFARLATAARADFAAAPDLDPDDPVAARLAAVAGRRGNVEPPLPGQDDLPDPYRGTLEAARACATEVAGIVELVLEVVRLRDDAEPPPHR